MTSSPNRLSLSSKRQSQFSQEEKPLLIALCRRNNGDIEASQLFDFVIIDLREDDLLLHPQGAIPSSVENLLRDSPEILHARQGDIKQFVQKLEHLCMSQCHRDS